MPQMSDEERRIGFNGTKLEDVNKTSFFGRIRGSVGLGAGLALELAYTPPIEAAGRQAEPARRGARAARSRSAPTWRLGVRGYGQIGNDQGRHHVQRRRGRRGQRPADKNPYQCVEPSKDESRQKAIGLELAVGLRQGRLRSSPTSAWP